MMSMNTIIYSQSLKSKSANKEFEVNASLNYISSATIQFSPFSPDLVQRNLTTDTKGGYGYGVSIRKKFLLENLYIGLSADYVSITDDGQEADYISGKDIIRVRATEKITVIPVEITGYFNTPSFESDLNIYFGGGIGINYGNRTRKIGNVESETLEKTPGLNLVVLSGFEYLLEKNVSAFLEFRFRSGQFRVKGKYPQNSVVIDNFRFPLNNEELNSRIYLDGIKLSLGIAYKF